jgi:hypothetical protein
VKPDIDVVANILKDRKESWMRRPDDLDTLAVPIHENRAAF